MMQRQQEEQNYDNGPGENMAARDQPDAGESQPDENDNDNDVVEGYIWESMQRNA